MKIITQGMMMLAFLLTSFVVRAQDIDLTSGDFSALKDQKAINIEFNYDKMSVGDFSDDAAYIKNKTNEMNTKEPGTGDKWAKEWIDNRKEKFEPKFVQMFAKESKLILGNDSKYTLIFKVTALEPGYNVGVKKRDAAMDGVAYLVETAHKDKILGKATITRHGSGNSMFRGAAFDAGTRITEVYGRTGAKLGKYVRK
jgi:hypothetical protein